MIDTHCHLDEYPDLAAVVRGLESAGVTTVAVTSFPSAFVRLRDRVRGQRRVRIALGLHPLHAAALPDAEWRLFDRFLDQTSYVGEVGLDFSPQGIATRPAQERAFRRVLQAVAGRGKFLSIHSRRAEEAVLEALNAYAAAPAVFHWYSGSLRSLDRVLAAGHYCSFNPAMVASARGRTIIAHVPRDRVLAETDGPFVRVVGRPAAPPDVSVVYRHLARQWQEEVSIVVDQLRWNLLALIRPEGAADLTTTSLTPNCIIPSRNLP